MGLIKFYLVAIVVCLSTQLHAQAWFEKYQEASGYYQSGDIQLAYIKSQECLTEYLAQDGSISGNYAAILRLLSNLCYENGNYKEGISYAEKEITIKQQINSSENLELATALYNLGSLYLINSQYSEAQKAFIKSLDIYHDFLPEDHLDIIRTYWKLGSVFLNIENIASANENFTKGFSLLGSSGIEDADYLSACYDFGNASLSAGDYENAIIYLQKTADIYASLGYKETNTYATIQLQIGEAYNGKKAYDKAITHFDEVITISSQLEDELLQNKALKGKAFSLQALGKTKEANQIYSEQVGDDPASLNNAAAISFNNGNIIEAEEYYNKALNILKNDSLIYSKPYLEILNNLINLHLTTDSLSIADSLLVVADEIAGVLNAEFDPVYASVLMKHAQLYQKKHDFESSDQYYSKAEDVILQTAGNQSAEYINLLNNKAVLYLEKGKFNESEGFLKNSIAISETINYPVASTVGLINNLAALYQEQGQFILASNLLQDGITMLEGIDASPYLMGNAYRQSALLDMQLGNYEIANENLQKAKEIFLDYYGRDNIVLVQHSIDQARLLQAQAKYADAEANFIEAISKMKLLIGFNHPDYLEALNSFGILYQTMGNYSMALKHFQQSKEGYFNLYGSYHPGYATSIENISTTYQLMDKVDEVEDLLKEAIEIDKVIYGKHHPKYSITLHNLATLYLRQDKFEEAIPLYEEALHIYKNSYGDEHPSYANTLYNLAIVHQETLNYDTAEAMFNETLAIREKTLGKNHPEYAFTLAGLAMLYHHKNDLEKAKPIYKEAVRHYLNQINNYFPALSEKEKSAFFNKIKPIFSAYYDYSITYYQNTGDSDVLNDMYDLQLSTKAILLNAANKVRDRILASDDNDLIARYERWNVLKEQLVKVMNMSAVEQQESVVTISNLEEEINFLEKELSVKSELFSETFEKEVVTWKEIQIGLPENTAAIEIIRINKRFMPDSVIYAALILKKDQDPTAVVMPKGQKLDVRYYNYYRNAIHFTQPDTISYNNYWRPIGDQLEGIKKCYISTDGIYNKISLNTLFDPAHSTSLIDEYDIRLVSNTKEIVESHQLDTLLTNEAIVFGSPDFNLNGVTESLSIDPGLTRMFGFSEKGIPPLPGTKVEAENVQSILRTGNWDYTIFIEEEATEENFKKIENPRILHVATHGFFMSDLDVHDQGIGLHLNNPEANPLFRSGLLLTGASINLTKDKKNVGEDGILTAYEAMNLHLDKTEIVILSACETGLGEIKNGEGVYGLQRSLIVAGANSILMSLWKVNDETTMQLMTFFYENLLNGEDKFTAFKNAQLKLRNIHSDPYHWGAFVMLGK